MRDALDWLAFRNWVEERTDALADWWRGLDLASGVLVTIGAVTVLLFLLMAAVAWQG